MVVIMILAAVAIPMGMRATVEAREAKLRSTLRELRTAIGSFTADCGGYPHAIKDLMEYTVPKHCENTADASNMPVDAADFRGPYLIPADGQVPMDPITREREWSYDNPTGRVASKATGTAMDGSKYSEW